MIDAKTLDWFALFLAALFAGRGGGRWRLYNIAVSCNDIQIFIVTNVAVHKAVELGSRQSNLFTDRTTDKVIAFLRALTESRMYLGFFVATEKPKHFMVCVLAAKALREQRRSHVLNFSHLYLTQSS